MSGGHFFERLKEESKDLCFVCIQNGDDPAQLYSYGSWVTLVGFNPGERPHNHDDNCHVEDFACEKGHHYSVRRRNTCPACNWKGSEKCFCHPLGARIYKDRSVKVAPFYEDIEISDLERVNRPR